MNQLQNIVAMIIQMLSSRPRASIASFPGPIRMGSGNEARASRDKLKRGSLPEQGAGLWSGIRTGSYKCSQ